MQRGKYIEVEKSEDIWRLEKNAVWREKKTDANHIHTIVVFARHKLHYDCQHVPERGRELFN